MPVGLAAYRAVLADPRARAFSLAGFVARLPISMTGIGTVLLVSLTTGSFGRAGLVTGVGTLTAAAAAPLWGRTIDRLGQTKVLLAAAVIYVVGVALLIATVLLDAPLAVTLLASAVAGIGFSSAGAAVRARWNHRLRGSALLDTAYAVEAVLDEVIFIIGPVLVTFLATAIHPALGLAVCAGFGLAGAVALAAQRSTQPPVGPSARSEGGGPSLQASRLVPIALASATLGAVFGGMELVVIAFARAAGVLPYAGLILMAWAIGSLLAAVVVGSLEWKATPALRFRTGALALALSLVPLPFVSSPVLMAVLLTLSGMAIAPTMIASVAVTSASVPGSRLTEALSWNSTGLAAGLAGGAAVLGLLVDRGGPVAGFWGVVAAGGLLIVAVMFVRSGRTAPEPATAETGGLG